MNQLAELLARQYMQNGASYDLSAFLKDMTKRFVEACTSAEIDHFLDDQTADKRRDSAQQRAGVNSGAEPAEASGEVSTSRNKRNDYSERTGRTTNGAFTVNMPRDRNGEFMSGLLPKYVRMFPDLDEKVIRL